MLINFRNAMMTGGEKLPTAKDYAQTGLVSQWDSFDGYNQTSGHFFDLINGAEVSDSKITRTQNGFMNYSGIGLVNLRTGLTIPDDFTVEACVKVNSVTAIGSNRAEMVYAYGYVSLMMYVNAWYAIPSNSYIPYGGSDDQFTVSFQIYGSNQTSASFPRNSWMFFGGVNKASVVAKPITGTTLGIGRDSYTSMDVDIYSLRLYSRALTAAEIAANYAIDKARFGLP